MKTQSTCEKAVAEGYLCNVLVGNTNCHTESGNTVAPVIDIVLGITYNGGITGSTAGRVNSHYILLINGKKPEKKELLKSGDKLSFGGITLTFDNKQVKTNDK